MTVLASQAYRKAESLDAALAALAQGACQVLAGGTDVYPALVGCTPRLPMLDIGALDELRQMTSAVVADRPVWRLGALTTWAMLRPDTLPGWARALSQAAREVGGLQIQNRGTVGGNLCHASPAADGVPALLALDARLVLQSQSGQREMPLSGFVLGPRRTAREPGELLTDILLPQPAGPCASSFSKLGHRRYLVISIAMVAIALELAPDGRIGAARIAVGACGPAAIRLSLLEDRLIGLASPLAPSLLDDLVDAQALEPLRPIDDIRATAAYRFDAVASLIKRDLAALSREIPS